MVHEVGSLRCDCSHLSQIHQAALSLTAQKNACICLQPHCLQARRGAAAAPLRLPDEWYEVFSAWLQLTPAALVSMAPLRRWPATSAYLAWQLLACSLPDRSAVDDVKLRLRRQEAPCRSDATLFLPGCSFPNCSGRPEGCTCASKAADEVVQLSACLPAASPSAVDGLKLHLRPQNRLGQTEGTEAAQLDVERIQRELAAELPELAQAAQLAREQPGDGGATPDVVRQVCAAEQELCESPMSIPESERWLHL